MCMNVKGSNSDTNTMMERLKAFFVTRSYDLGVEKVRWYNCPAKTTEELSICDQNGVPGWGNA